MIDLTRDQNSSADMTQLEATQAMALAYALPVGTCNCGDAECLGPADAVIPVVEALAATLPQLQSPMLKLIKERNEARRLCELLAGSFPDIAALTNKKAIDAANGEMHQALWAYCKTKKDWDKRSYQIGGAE